MPYVGAENVPGRGINALDTATNSSDPSSAGQQAVIAYLQSKGMPVNPGNIRRAIEANAREPGDPSANGPNLGPVVLNLRNAGIEDASPMPARGGGGGGGRTSASPTQAGDTSAPPPDRTVEPSLPSDRPNGYIPTPRPVAPGSIPEVNEALPPKAEGQVPLLSSPPGTPLLPSPSGQAALPAPPLGPDVLAGRSLMDLLRYAGQQLTTPVGDTVSPFRMLMTPEAGRRIVGPVPPPQVGGPQVGAPQLPAPGEAPPIALGNQSTGRPAIPLPDANVRPPLLQTPGVDLQRPPASQANLPQPPVSQAGTPNISGAIDDALKPPAIEQAPVKSRARGGRRR